jgi:tetratricopeptide (TPR) repeat protein/serine/threonine protein kinase
MTRPVLDNPDLSQAERIDLVCTAFEAAWKAEDTPRLEDWLRDAPEADRPALLHELLLVEVHYRRLRGDPVEAAEYRRRFPELEQAGLEEVAGPAPKMAPGPSTVGPSEDAATDPDQPAPGTVRYAGGYELAEEIGRGGMGVVYRGRDTDLRRTLAVKVLLERHGHSEELQRRFLEEAQVMGQLQHPGVAPIHGTGRLADGRPFFSMKQIQGQTLAEMLKERGAKSANPPATIHDPRLLAIFEQVCQTVAFAHSRGILHRDLKPHNVMVGAFAEVQVMDWGLAKRIAEGQAPTADCQNPLPEAAVANLQSALDHQQSTEAGRVLGTPAYMAPEQARGEVDSLDERADVFGLGGILCEVLTGQPPFPGDTQLDSHRKAMTCDLQETLDRLEGCGADGELVQLALRCLAAAKEDRPRHAGEVAGVVAAYQAGVGERLRQAEVERASAQVKAGEERKRRRVWLALALIFVLAAAGAGLWYVQRVTFRQQVERDLEPQLAVAAKQSADLRDQLANPLTASKLLSDIEGWKARVAKARDSWTRAKFLADSGEGLLEDSWFAQLNTLDRQIQADEEDWQNAKELDNVRLLASLVVDGYWDLDPAITGYLPIFQKLTVDPTKGEAGQIADQIKKLPLRYALVAALDHWADKLHVKTRKDHQAANLHRQKQEEELGQQHKLAQQEKLMGRLLHIARLADPDDWRDRVRDEKAWRNPATMIDLAKKAPLQEQSPQIILLLAWRVKATGGLKQAPALLRDALFYYPKDFWLHFDLGSFVADQNPAEGIGCFRAALAVRPDNAAALTNLGVLLGKAGGLEESIKHFQKALKFSPKLAYTHANLCSALFNKKDYEGALQHGKKAVEFGPNLAAAHNNLGFVLQEKKELDRAIQHFNKAIELEPTFVLAHSNLGTVLRGLGDLDGAIKHCHKALELAPTMAAAHYNLGLTLMLHKDLDGAVRSFQKAIDLDPDMVDAHHNLGVLLAIRQDFAGATEHLKKAIALDPNPPALAHTGLGKVLKEIGDVDGAITHFQKAIEIDPQFAKAHFHLGLVFHEKKDLEGSIRHFQKALEIDPNDTLIKTNLALIKTKLVMAHANLTKALQAAGDLDGAVEHFRKVVDLVPEDPQAHYNLGCLLYEKKDLDGAIQSYQKAVVLNPKHAEAHCNLGHSLRQQGHLAEALKALQKGHELGTKQAGWSYPSAEWVKQCERLVELDQKLPSILKGTAQPRDAAEQTDLAHLCLVFKKQYVASARFYAATLKTDPPWASQIRYAAACAAVLAATAQGKDADQLLEGEPAKWHQQALAWLKEDLAVLKQQLTTGPGPAAPARQTLKKWQTDPALAGVREPKELAKLPEAERKAWQALWAEVETLLKPAIGKNGGAAPREIGRCVAGLLVWEGGSVARTPFPDATESSPASVSHQFVVRSRMR